MTAPQLSPGQSVAGKFSIRALLGYGGATATYAATTAQGRDVVVRLLSPQLGTRGDVLGALQQTSVFTNSMPDATAPILESGFDPQTGAPYTVTEHVTTQSLAQATQSGTLPVAEVVAIVQGIARAADAAHAQRIAHGGLKPQNVFVGPSPQRAVRVADFGMAAVRAALPTTEGSAIASGWMAPEQLQGAPASPASDVFAAGLITFFAATGKSYWRSYQGQQPDLAALQQEMAAPRIPASVRARELGASLAQGFDAILARALAQNPAERYASVGELADAVLKGGGPNKMAMTMPLNAMPLAAQEMLRKASSPAVAAAAAPAGPTAPLGGDTLAIQSPLDAQQWSPPAGSRPSAQPPTQAVPQMQTQPAMPPQMPQMQMPQQQMPPQQPMMQGLPPQGPGMPILTPLGGFQPPVNQGPMGGGPGPMPMGPGMGMQQGVHAQPSYGPPPESSVVVPKSKTGLIIALVVIALALVGGAVVLAVVLRRPSVDVETPTTAATQSAAQPPAATAASSAPAAATTSAPAATAAPSATAAAADTQATPEAGAPAAQTPEAGAAAPEQAVVTIVCSPECETIKVDDKALLNDSDASLFPASEPVDLSPGAHTIAITRTGYLPQTKRVTVKAAQKEKIAFFLAKPGGAAVPTKTCGKFLERCP